MTWPSLETSSQPPRRTFLLSGRRREEGLRRWETGWALASSRINGSRRSARRRSPSLAELPARHPTRLRVFTLNVAHGRSLARHQALLRRDTVERNLHDIATVFRHHQPDVVALQEADGPSAWSGNFDHVATLAELGGLGRHFRGEHNHFAVGSMAVSSGTALLSHLELRRLASHRFAQNWRDTKGFVTGTVEVPEWGGVEIDLISVHLEPLAAAVRRRQISEMAERLRGRSNPRLVLGDLNCGWKPRCEFLELLTEELGVSAYRPRALAPTYPAFDPRLRLDWILASPDLRFVEYHTVQRPLSDHLGVVADLELL